MNKLLTIVAAVLFSILLPVIASANPTHLPPPPHGYTIQLYCYNVYFPYAHSKCEYRYVRVYRHYRQAPVMPHHVGPRPGHHPPPNHRGPDHHGPNGHHGHR